MDANSINQFSQNNFENEYIQKNRNLLPGQSFVGSLVSKICYVVGCVFGSMSKYLSLISAVIPAAVGVITTSVVSLPLYIFGKIFRGLGDQHFEEINLIMPATNGDGCFNLNYDDLNAIIRTERKIDHLIIGFAFPENSQIPDDFDAGNLADTLERIGPNVKRITIENIRINNLIKPANSMKEVNPDTGIKLDKKWNIANVEANVTLTRKPFFPKMTFYIDSQTIFNTETYKDYEFGEISWVITTGNIDLVNELKQVTHIEKNTIVMQDSPLSPREVQHFKKRNEKSNEQFTKFIAKNPPVSQANNAAGDVHEN